MGPMNGAAMKPFQKNRKPLISSLLVLCSYREKNILITSSPVLWQAFLDAMRMLGEQTKYHIRTTPDDSPGFFSPNISFLHKKIRAKSYIHLHARRIFETTVSLSLKRHGKVLCPENLRRVNASLAIQKVHVAVLTSFTDFMAAVPWIPDNHIVIIASMTKSYPLKRIVPLLFDKGKSRSRDYL